MNIVGRLLIAGSVSAAIVCVAHPAAAQDLSRYRDFPFGTSVASLAAMTGTNPASVKVIHQRPALIQELVWRPQYPTGRSAAKNEAVQEITFGFLDDQLFSVSVMYDARLVAGLTNQDLIDAVSTVYGTATLTPASSKDFVQPPLGSIYSSRALARWQSADHEFTLMRETYPATFRLVGVSKQLDSLAKAAAIEAVRLDREEAPRREAERVKVEAERKAAAEDKVRATNKSEFRP